MSEHTHVVCGEYATGDALQARQAIEVAYVMPWGIALRSDWTPAHAFFNLVSGIALLIASTVAGLLWEQLGPSFTFYAGTGFCVIALMVLIRRY